MRPALMSGLHQSVNQSGDFASSLGHRTIKYNMCIRTTSVYHNVNVIYVHPSRAHHNRRVQWHVESKGHDCDPTARFIRTNAFAAAASGSLSARGFSSSTNRHREAYPSPNTTRQPYVPYPVMGFRIDYVWYCINMYCRTYIYIVYTHIRQRRYTNHCYYY